MLDLDVDSLKILDDCHAADKNKVYYKKQILQNVHADSFSKLGLFFWRDKNNVYCDNKALALDPQKAQIHDETYALDDSKVFFLEKELTRLSADAFVSLGYNIARDKKYVYYRDDWVPEADASTFEVISYSQFRDRNHRYKIRNNKMIIDA